MENKEVKKTVKTKEVATVYIPLDNLNPTEKTVQVTVNGRGWTLVRDKMINNVPIEVADALKDSGTISSYSVEEVPIK